MVTSDLAATVLLVDDDEDVRAVLRELLELEGYEVLEAAHGAHALQVLDRCSRPCVLVLDLMMPVMDGWRFLEEVRARPELADSLPVVVVSASRALPEGPPVRAALTKPFPPEALLEAIEPLCTSLAPARRR